MLIRSFSVVAAPLLLLGSAKRVAAAGEALIEPVSVSSVNGTLSVVLTLEVTDHATEGFALKTRAFNGTVPGPTLRLAPGDLLAVDFYNNLPDQGIPYKHNEFSAPDETNLHFHGLHISGELPSDDTTIHILPGESYEYRTTLPASHMPGTHWMHPHRHGSTALQAGGGAVAAVIVEDPPNYLPPQVEEAREILLVVKPIYTSALADIASDSGDTLLNVLYSPGDFVAVNGQVQPVITMDPEEWVRFRIVNAGWRDPSLTLSFQGCEMQLLAKDGIYIRDFPRAISSAPMPTGGRADIMVRCMAASTSYSIVANGAIATIQTTAGPAAGTSALEPWTPVFPPYLEDLRNTPASEGCSCETVVGTSGGINGRKFEYDTYLHTSYLGAVLERKLSSRKHPYHQHVYPFQLVGHLSENDYYKLGDWHDTFVGQSPSIRFQPNEFDGRIMMHCHRINHEDKGMMAAEWVYPTGNVCECGKNLTSLPTWAIAVIVVASVIAFLVLLYIVWKWCKGRNKGEEGGGEDGGSEKRRRAPSAGLDPVALTEANKEVE